MGNGKAEAVAEINRRLKAAGCNVAVRSKGKNGYLYLRATLPLKNGEGSKQQDVSLHLPPSVKGLKLAEAKAHELSQLIISDRFSWDLYLPKKEEVSEQKTIAQWIEEFKQHYFATHNLSDRTWQEHWAKPVYNRLPQGVEISEGVLMALILKTDPGTRLRKQTCQKLQKLAQFTGLKIDLTQYQGGYGLSKTEARYIPGDEEILDCYEKISSDSWRLVYSLLCTFGLRPHEAFFCEFLDSYTLRVREGKTGERIASALPPEWIESFGFPIELNYLTDSLPAINRKQPYQQIGLRVNKQFNRMKVPFAPYSLRHAYAIRSSVVYGLPVSVSAAMMGHSPDVHLRIYHRWMSTKQTQQVYRDRVLKPNGVDLIP